MVAGECCEAAAASAVERALSEQRWRPFTNRGGRNKEAAVATARRILLRCAGFTPPFGNASYNGF